MIQNLHIPIEVTVTDATISGLLPRKGPGIWRLTDLTLSLWLFPIATLLCQFPCLSPQFHHVLAGAVTTISGAAITGKFSIITVGYGGVWIKLQNLEYSMKN